ncbi:PREDICTED: CAAX prenyl protease 1 homolog [Papilio xuthus]|uniref:CAAX prenyl protease n=1 Tax=Papilio xuthus TaxID=66420 RepID=A0A194PL15_PAPXU|nr:PREDICTED: CAAX prenyl protease 1 homolog [Papilio xuthus]KPI94126.1 CAAX prenyl protease 1-like [Papilio xuthus]
MVSGEDLIVWLILIFSWAEYLWELYLTLRQLKIYHTNKTIPDELKEMLNEESIKKARLYGIDKSKFKIAKELYNIILISVILYKRWIYVAWYKSEMIAESLNITPDQEIIVTCIFMTFVTLFNFVMNMPIKIYATFVLEENHGFNKQTALFFIKDQLKSLLLGLVITLPIISIALYIIMLGGNMFVVWLWMFTTLTTLLLLALYPTVIAPLFDKFVPLPDNALRKGIEDLASKLNFPLSQIYIVKGSKRSAHSNAYFSGLLGAKRIVLFDTLLESHDKTKNVTTGCTDDEILGILAHELGHWSCSHIYKSIALTEVNLLLLFTAFGILFKYSTLYTAIGFPTEQEPIIIGLLVILQLILAPYNSLLSYFATALSRKFEFEADNFAINLKYANELRSALIKLGKDNLDYPIYDKLYSAWYHSHPTLLHRIENINNKISNEKKD